MYFIKVVNDWKIKNQDDIKAYILTRNDWFYSVEIKKFWDRTIQSNKYYRGYLLKYISEHTWHSPQELHYFYKFKILWVNWDWMPSTKELGQVDFNWYMEQIKNHAATIWVVVPELN